MYPLFLFCVSKLDTFIFSLRFFYFRKVYDLALGF